MFKNPTKSENIKKKNLVKTNSHHIYQHWSAKRMNVRGTKILLWRPGKVKSSDISFSEEKHKVREGRLYNMLVRKKTEFGQGRIQHLKFT